MTEKLFDKIKKLEQEIEQIKNKNRLIAKNLKNIFKECKIDKNKKDLISKELNKNLEALTNIELDKSFENGILSFNKFLEFVNGYEDVYIVGVKLTDDSVKNRYIYRFFTKQFSSLFSVKENILFGLIEKRDIGNIKKINKIPFFNPDTEEISDIELFKIVFETPEISFAAFNKIILKFKELSNRPSFKTKHFIEYSLRKERIVDFEMEEMQKKKNRYSYIFDENYPDLELKLKSNITNAPFLLALLEKIDTEIDEIKQSRGIENVVNRILNFIELKTNESEIRKMVKILRKSLKK